MNNRKITTTKPHRPPGNFSKLRTVAMLLWLLLAAGWANAQDIINEAGYPRFDGTPLVTLEDERTLQLWFTPTDVPLDNGKIVITMPDGIESGTITSSSGATFTHSRAGQVVTINVTSTLTQNASAKFEMKVKAKCRDVGNATFIVKVFKGTSSLKQDEVSIQVDKPNLTFNIPAQTIAYTTPTEQKEVTYFLRSTTQPASSAKVVFTVPADKVKLSDFKLNGATVTATEATASGKRTYTLTFASVAALGGSKIDNTNNKKVTFKAQGFSTTCGAQTILSSAQFPHNENCGTNTGTPVTLNMGDLGNPAFTPVSIGYVATATQAAPTIEAKDLNMDGTTVTYCRAVFQNNSAAAAKQYESVVHVGPLAYIDESKCFVQIDNGPLKPIPPSAISQKVYARSLESEGFLKSELGDNKLRRCFLTIAETVPSGSKVTFYIGTVNGAIHDNTGRDVFNSTTAFSINHIQFGINHVMGFCENKNENKVPQIISGIFSAHYQGKPSNIHIDGTGGGTPPPKTVSIKVAPGSVGLAKAEFTIKTPSWLKITDVKLGSNPDGTGTSYADVSVTGAGPVANLNTHTVSIQSTVPNRMLANYNLVVTYQPDPCGGGTDKTGTIVYTNKQYFSGGALENMSQLLLPVEQLCTINGVKTDSLYLYRITRGYAATGNSREPLSDTPAADDKITHNFYLNGDRGELRVRAKLSGSSGYKYMYVNLDTYGNMEIGNETNDHIKLDGTATLTENGMSTAVTVSYRRQTNKRGYFELHNTAGFSPNAEVIVHMPFTINTNGLRTNGSILQTINAKTSVSAVHDDTGVGVGSGTLQSNATVNIPSSFVNPTVPNPIVFTNNRPLPNTQFSWIDFNSIAFQNEVRFLAYLEKFEIDVPTGYTIDDSLNIHRYNANQTGNNVKQINSPSRTSIPNGTRITWNVADNVYQISAPAGTLTPGKWRLPDENWGGLYPRGTIYVHPLVPNRKDSAALIVRGYYRDSRTGQPFIFSDGKSVRSYNCAVIYEFKSSMTAVPDSAVVYGPTATGPQITVKNDNTTALEELYLYFKGPVKDVTMTDVLTNTSYGPITGGHNGCWVKVSNIPSSSRVTYDLKYTSTITDCSAANKDVIVFACAKMGDPSWTGPNTANPYDENDVDHFVARTRFRLVPSRKSKIESRIEIIGVTKKDTVPEGDSGGNKYKVEILFSSKSSDGMLKDLAMNLRVPQGQFYVPGSAKIIYGSTNSVPTTSALETALNVFTGTDRLQATDGRTAMLRLSDCGIANLTNLALSGYKSSGYDNGDSVKLVLEFRAMCNTPFTGMYYKGEVTANNICGDPADQSGNTITSRRIYPDVAFAYRFDKIVPAFSSTSRAFNEGRTQDTLQLDITRIVGETSDMELTDYMLVEMPKQLKIRPDDSIYYVGNGSGSLSALNWKAAIQKDTVMPDGVRQLKLSFPIDAYNALSSGQKKGSPIRCRIPVEYEPDGQTRAATPIDSVRAMIWSNLQFGNCAPVPTPFCTDSAALKIALITAAQWPHRLYIGERDTIKNTSAGFDGDWYLTATGGTHAHIGNNWPRMETDTAMLGDTVYYFTPTIDGTQYGTIRLPYAVKIWIHPWFIKPLDSMRYVCTEVDTLRVKAGGMEVKYQWFQDLAPLVGQTDTMLVVTKPGKYHVLVTDTVPETISSDTMDVYFREMPVFSKDLPQRARECDRWGYWLEVETPLKFVQYQWYRDGLPIKGATDRRYYALSADSSAYFRVVIKNPCGDSLVSRQCYLSFCDEATIKQFSRSVELDVPANATVTPGRGVFYVQSLNDFVFTVKPQTGFVADWLNITTDNPIWSMQGGIEREMQPDSSMKVTLRMVNRNLKIKVGGLVPLGNESVTDDGRPTAWAHRGRIVVRTADAQAVRIYTAAGLLYRREQLSAGTAQIAASPGFYLVRFDDGTTCKVFVE